jgi:hypothetical protein
MKFCAFVILLVTKEGTHSHPSLPPSFPHGLSCGGLSFLFLHLLGECAEREQCVNCGLVG